MVRGVCVCESLTTLQASHHHIHTVYWYTTLTRLFQRRASLSPPHSHSVLVHNLDSARGYRVTCPEALEVAMEAAGRNNVLVQALLSRGINVAVTRKHGESSSKGGGGGMGSGDGGGGGSGGGAGRCRSQVTTFGVRGAPLHRKPK